MCRRKRPAYECAERLRADLRPELCHGNGYAAFVPVRVIYWQDDTHWNECGVTIAVAEFRAQIGSQTLRAFVGGALPPAHPSAAGTARKAALSSNCLSQQEYAAASLSAP